MGPHSNRAAAGTNRERARTARFGVVASALVAFALLATTSAIGSSGGRILSEDASFRHHPKPIPDASAIALPSTTQCLRQGKLTFQLRKLKHVQWVGVTVKVNGAQFATIGRSQVTQPVTLTDLPSGRIVLLVSARTSRGRTVAATKTYRSCVTRPEKPPKKAPEPTPTPPTPTPTPTPPNPPQSPPQPGSYTGSAASVGLSFYVSADGTKLQDVSIPGLGVRCTPGNGTFGTQFNVPEIEIAADGSFSKTVIQQGVLSGATASFEYTFSGHVQGTTGSGTVSDVVTYDDGTSFSCLSGGLAWSATRDAQGDQTASPPPAGSYTGAAASVGLSFYVSPDGTKLQDVSIPGLSVRCAPGNVTFGTQFNVPEIEIAADGSFSKTVIQQGVLSGATASFEYIFSGHVHGYGSNGKARLAGAVGDVVTYDDGTSHTCRSGGLAWSATRDAQGDQTASPPPAGSYTGAAASVGLSFYVSPDDTELQDVSIPGLSVRCAPGNVTFGTQFNVPEIEIQADGSFSKTVIQQGVISGAAANFEYTFSGHVHGPGSNGKVRLAGAVGDVVTYDDGTSHTCRSGGLAWSATRDAQGDQTASPPPDGSYTGAAASVGLSFSVAASGTKLQSVSIPGLSVRCAPGNLTFGTQFNVPEIEIQADGSFSKTVIQAGVVSGFPANFEYTFSGHVHGPGSNGKVRLAGAVGDVVTYNDGTSRTCRSGGLAWSATN
jgi:hypothetical protein